jgi:hypothetical protein
MVENNPFRILGLDEVTIRQIERALLVCIGLTKDEDAFANNQYATAYMRLTDSWVRSKAKVSGDIK